MKKREGEKNSWRGIRKGEVKGVNVVQGKSQQISERQENKMEA